MMNSFFRFHLSALLLAALLIAAAPLLAHEEDLAKAGMTSSEQARDLKNVGIEEHLGDGLDLNLNFTDENGQVVPLSHYYDGSRPVVISPVYYSCPGLCSFHLNGVVDALKKMDWSAGNQFQYLAISFDPREKSDLAAKKKESYMKVYDRSESDKGWHFLTGDAATIAKLTQQIGFKYEWKKDTQEWAHASAAIVTTPKGQISRYLHGIMFDEKTFKLALIEAGEGKIGTFVDRMIWYCFHYDPKLSKYTIYATNIMKIGGAVMILVLAGILLPVWIRSRREQT